MDPRAQGEHEIEPGLAAWQLRHRLHRRGHEHAATVSIDDLPDKVKRKDLENGRLLTLHLTVSEPATTGDVYVTGEIPALSALSA